MPRSRSDDKEAVNAESGKPLLSASTTSTTLATNASEGVKSLSSQSANNKKQQDPDLAKTSIKLNDLNKLSSMNGFNPQDGNSANLLDKSPTDKMNEEEASRRTSGTINTPKLSQDSDPESGDVQVARQESNLVVSLKIAAIFSTLYFFMWSSSLLSQAFELASHHYAGHFIRTSGFLQNPLIGLMVGVITTVVFQSSGAVTSVLVTIVGSGVLTVRQSIPIIMGANLGTSVTNTVVSLIVYRNKRNFEIAMTAGIVHDMYNMMSVVFLLPIELLFRPLEVTSEWMLNLLGHSTSISPNGNPSDGGSDLQFLSVLVKPLVNAIIMIDKEKTAKLDPGVIVPSNISLVKICCNEERRGNETICHQRCMSLFSHLEFSDNVVCILLLIIAMATLFTCLVFVVKVTKSLLG